MPPDARVYDLTFSNPDLGLIKNLVSFVRVDFDPKSSIHFKFDDHFISPDSRFADLRGHYTNLGQDAQPVTLQMVTLLEVKEGKVIKEST